MACFRNPQVALEFAVLSTYKHNPYNAENHLRSVHTKDELPEYYRVGAQQKKLFPVKGECLTLLNQMKIDPHNITTPSKQMSSVIAKGNELLYKFFNTANIAVYQADNAHLQAFASHMVDNAQVYKQRKKAIGFSRWHYKSQELRIFTEFISFVKSAVDVSRNFYNNETGCHVPFITVSHDGWDSKKRDILGCCIHFIVPGQFVFISVPVGLKYLSSKKSEETVEHLNKILAR